MTIHYGLLVLLFAIISMWPYYIHTYPLSMVEYSKTELPCLKMAASDKQPADRNFYSCHAPILHSVMDKSLREYTLYTLFLPY